MLYLFTYMARGRGHGKSSSRSTPAIRYGMPTVSMSTIVSPQQGGTPTTQNQNNLYVRFCLLKATQQIIPTQLLLHQIRVM